MDSSTNIHNKDSSPSLTTSDVSIPTTLLSLDASSHRTPSFSSSHATLALTPDETDLFDILTNVQHEYNQNNPSTSLLEIRVAGGWVRDKLLALDTHDMDLAVNCMSGVQFAELLVQCYNKHHQQKTTKTKKIGIIAANPEQSKHLETATLVLHTIELDISTLRSHEVYTLHSRIPTTRLGTPLQDAQRRDFTVNALYYNVGTCHVEDWTQRGIQDLQRRYLVTPLEALETFRDDPLRVLRAIRFAVRYSFQLDPALEHAAMHPEIHKALHVKVSRERVGKELEGMVSGRGANAVVALREMARLKLAGSVFCLPTQEYRDGVTIQNVRGEIAGRVYIEGESDEARQVRAWGWQEAVRLLEGLPRVMEAYHATSSVLITSSSSPTVTTRVNERLLPLATFLLPFRQLYYQEGKKTMKEYRAIQYIMRDGIKFKNKDVHAMTILMDAVDQMTAFLTDFGFEQGGTTNEQDTAASTCRLEAGLMLRATKDLWVTCLLLATVVKLGQAQQGNDGVSEHVVDWIQTAMAAYRSIVSLNLDECWKMKPLLDGKAVITALSLSKGPQVGDFLDEQVRWMLLNPQGTKEEVLVHLQSVKRRMEEQSPSNELCLGISDGMHTSTPRAVQGREVKHFSKKMHVENMDLE